jgi:hypothetical protein
MNSRIFLLLPLLFLSFDQPKMVKTKLTADISALIPKGWIPMGDLDFMERYPSVRAPLAAYTNDDRTADFSVNTSATQWPDGNLELAQKFFKASLMNMFDKVTVISEGVREVHGRKYVYFEFESRINGNREEAETNNPVLRYTQLQFLIERDRTLVFSFNCPIRLREEWNSTATAILKSIKVN